MTDRRDHRLPVRVTAAERRELRELAARAGVPLSLALRLGARAWLHRLIEREERAR